MIAKQISKAHKKSFFKGYQMQPWAKFHLFYKLKYVMNRCFTSEETPCIIGNEDEDDYDEKDDSHSTEKNGAVL